MSPKSEQFKLPGYNGKAVVLNTGQHMPLVGLGTFQDPEEQEDSVYSALKCGYRHIDTAHKHDSPAFRPALQTFLVHHLGLADHVGLPAMARRSRLARASGAAASRGNRSS